MTSRSCHYRPVVIQGQICEFCLGFLFLFLQERRQVLGHEMVTSALPGGFAMLPLLIPVHITKEYMASTFISELN